MSIFIYQTDQKILENLFLLRIYLLIPYVVQRFGYPAVAHIILIGLYCFHNVLGHSFFTLFQCTVTVTEIQLIWRN